MLLRKMFRDLKENKGAYIACIVVIVIGLMTFSSFSMAIRNLKLSQEDFYTEETFADGFANVRSMPTEKIKKLGNIEGIQDIQGRIVHDVRVMGGSQGKAREGKEVYLRLISLDLENADIINNMRLLQGVPLGSNKLNIWLDNKFFEANNMSLNDEIKVIIDGKEKTLQLAGVGMSPEFVYALRTESDMFPDPEKFGIAFAPLGVVETLFPGKGTVNNIVFTLKPGVAYEDVKGPLESELKPYGLERIFSRADQVSHIMLDLEIRNVEAVARYMPLIFLSIAGIILFIMLKRLTEQQRGQIGILKAFGYTSKEIMMHY
ncbi:MAG TPA: FtsX-like permease family protein, partial [Clostridia bacterium]|nr:FtsX-like permease family protein [Clostridia bacterium]